MCGGSTERRVGLVGEGAHGAAAADVQEGHEEAEQYQACRYRDEGGLRGARGVWQAFLRCVEEKGGCLPLRTASGWGARSCERVSSCTTGAAGVGGWWWVGGARTSPTGRRPASPAMA